MRRNCSRTKPPFSVTAMMISESRLPALSDLVSFLLGNKVRLGGYEKDRQQRVCL